MSKELTSLEAFETIKRTCIWDDMPKVVLPRECDIVEKSLKALEIIKENLKHFVDYDDFTNSIFIDCGIICDNKEEYDLLKEELL